jgi:hypothetical protein
MNDQTHEKQRLLEVYDRLSVWMKVFTGCVAVGLVVEYLPDVIKAIRTLTFPEPLIGALLITVGVAGELVILIWSSRYETRIREVNDLIIEETTERAERAEKQVTDLKKPRHLASAGYIELVKALAPHAGKRVDIVAFDHHDTEVAVLTDSLNAAFAEANWKNKLWWFSSGPRMSGEGVTIGIARERSQDESLILQAIAWEIVSVLGKFGIPASLGVSAFSKTDLTKSAEASGWLISEVATLRVQVVQKPLITMREIFPES